MHFYKVLRRTLMGSGVEMFESAVNVLYLNAKPGNWKQK